MKYPGYLTNVDVPSMGACEMECALAAMINLAHDSGKKFADLTVSEKDFKDDKFERDGYHDMLRYKWIVNGRPIMKLVERVHSMYPGV